MVSVITPGFLWYLLMCHSVLRAQKYCIIFYWNLLKPRFKRCQWVSSCHNEWWWLCAQWIYRGHLTSFWVNRIVLTLWHNVRGKPWTKRWWFSTILSITRYIPACVCFLPYAACNLQSVFIQFTTLFIISLRYVHFSRCTAHRYDRQAIGMMLSSVCLSVWSFVCDGVYGKIVWTSE